MTIISMGIGSEVDREELKEIAEDEEHVFIISDFDHMVDKLKTIAKLSCHASKSNGGEWRTTSLRCILSILILHLGVSNNSSLESKRTRVGRHIYTFPI